MYNATLNFAAPFDGVASVVLLGLTAASATMKASASIPIIKAVCAAAFSAAVVYCLNLS